MNDRKFSRHLGIIAEKVNLPIIQLGMELGKLAAAPIMGGRNSPSRFTGYGFFYAVDPPVGGFANADPIAQLPDTAAFQSIIAVKTFDTQLLFAPGHYAVQLCFTPPATAGLGYYMGFYEWDQDRTVLSGMGGGSAPFVGTVVRAASMQPQGFFQFPIYSPHLWQARIYAFGTHADANLGQVSGVISPVHLLDDYPSAT